MIHNYPGNAFRVKAQLHNPVSPVSETMLSPEPYGFFHPCSNLPGIES
jgi:hypothetical protein